MDLLKGIAIMLSPLSAFVVVYGLIWIADLVARHKKPWCLNCGKARCKVWGYWQIYDSGTNYSYKCNNCGTLMRPIYNDYGMHWVISDQKSFAEL